MQVLSFTLNSSLSSHELSLESEQSFVVVVVAKLQHKLIEVSEHLQAQTAN